MKTSEAVATAAPTFGPAFATVLSVGVPDLPYLSLVLSGLGLLLARVIAPAPLRPLSKKQHLALSALLLVILYVIVTGEFTGEPLKPGLAVVWGIGLGFSGLVAVELFGDRALAMLKVLFGGASGVKE